MFEEKRINRALGKNALHFFLVFAILFSLLGIFVYHVVNSNVFRHVDEQLNGVIDSTSVAIASFGEYSVWRTEQTEPLADTSSSPTSSNDESAAGVSPGSSLYPVVNSLSVSGQVIESTLEDSPYMIFLTRDEAGAVVDTEGIYANYPESFRSLDFDASLIDEIYTIKKEDHTYRAINQKLQEEDGTIYYLQSAINIDSETAILYQFTVTLIIGLVVALVACAGASFFLSKRTIKPIAEAWKKQTEFVQNASHELRTPLTIIHSTQELLLEDPQGAIIDHFEDISLTIEETDRLKLLTENLLSLSTADSKTTALEREEFELDHLIENVAIPYQEYALCQNKKIETMLTYGKKVSADQRKIKQVLSALLDNALKYTEADDTITISTTLKSESVVVTVADTGVGIDKEELEHVFDRFYRADKARTRNKEGFGLGLSIARSIIELHEGSVTMTCNEPKGVSVSFSIPLT